jgi:hypothetical protein
MTTMVYYNHSKGGEKMINREEENQLTPYKTIVNYIRLKLLEILELTDEKDIEKIRKIVTEMLKVLQ